MRGGGGGLAGGSFHLSGLRLVISVHDLGQLCLFSNRYLSFSLSAIWGGSKIKNSTLEPSYFLNPPFLRKCGEVLPYFYHRETILFCDVVKKGARDELERRERVRKPISIIVYNLAFCKLSHVTRLKHGIFRTSAKMIRLSLFNSYNSCASRER